MPLIPLLSSQAAPKLPGPVLDTQKRPNVDVTEIIQGQRALGQANKGPLVDPEPFARAAEAPYQAMAKVGNAVGQVMEKRREAKDRTALNQAHADMRLAGEEYGLWQAQNPNATDQYTTEAEKRAEAVRSKFAKLNLSGQAREDLDLMTGTWSKSLVIGAQTRAATQDFGNAKNSYMVRAQVAYEGGDKAGGDQALTEGASRGYIHGPEVQWEMFKGNMQVKQKARSDMDNDYQAGIEMRSPEIAHAALAKYGAAVDDPHYVERLRSHVGATVEYGKKVDSLMQLADTDPQVLLQQLGQTNDRGDVTEHTDLRGDDRRQIVRYAQGQAARFELADAELALKWIGKGLVQSPDDLAAFPYLSDDDKSVLKVRLAQGAANSPQGYAEMFDTISGYDPAKDANRYQYAQIKKQVKLLYDKENAEQLESALEDRVKGKKDSVPLTDVFSTITAAVKRGDFGPVEAQATKPDGTPLLLKKKEITQKPGRFWGTNTTATDVYTPLMKPDPVGTSKAWEKAAEVKDRLRKMVQDGTIKTEADAYQAYGKIMGMKVQARAASEAINTPGAALLPALTAEEIADLKKKYSKP